MEKGLRAMTGGRQAESAPRTYPTRVDWWLGSVGAVYVVIALGVPAWHLGTVLSSAQPFDPILLFFPPAILAALWAIAYPCEYSFDEKRLIVRSGMLRVRIPLLAITLVRPSRTLASAPAWSLDRLEIRYGRTQRVVLSPREKAEFLEELERRAPHLVRSGENLVVADDWKMAAEA